MYYILANNDIKFADSDRQKIENTLIFVPEYQGAEILETDKMIYMFDNKFYFEDDPIYIEKYARENRQRLDALTLTPADVERALYREKQMDFDDLKVLIAQQLPQIDIKGLAIEFRAKDFYRGAVANGVRLFDVVGQLLGYTSDDMDYLFEHKELPTVE